MPRNDDEGVVLIIVLMFVLVVSLVIGAVIQQARASIGNTVIVRNQQALTYASDSGIEVGIRRLRQDSRLCPETSPTPSALGSALASNGRSVALTCRTLQGRSSGVLGYAVVTTDDTGDSLTTQGGGNKKITGPVWTARAENSASGGFLSDLLVADGDLFEKEGPNSCSAGDSAPGGLTFAPPQVYTYKCTNSGQPDIAADLPTSVPAAPSPVVIGNCTVLFPGRYSKATDPSVVAGLSRAWPTLTEKTYLVSGVYLLDDIAVSPTGSQQIVGGRRGSERDALGLTPCSSDSAAPGTVGTGVKILLARGSTIATSSSGAAVELFSRQGGPVTTEGTQGITIQQVRSSNSAVPSTLLSTVGLTNDLLNVSSGSNPSLVVHGITYAPAARINVDNASNTSSAQFQGGILAGRLLLQNSGSSTGLVVSIETEETPRVVQIEARSKKDSGDKEIVATAVVRINNDATRSYQVLSWSSTN